jgi:hypothetical protein
VGLLAAEYAALDSAAVSRENLHLYEAIGSKAPRVGLGDELAEPLVDLPRILDPAQSIVGRGLVGALRSS